jgi:hypothetical protein
VGNPDFPPEVDVSCLPSTESEVYSLFSSESEIFSLFSSESEAGVTFICGLVKPLVFCDGPLSE